MKRVAAIRREIGRPTIFNLLGPLTNPAFVRRQIVGVPRMDLLETIALALGRLGIVRAFVVHGHDGLCDLTITGPSSYVELRDGRTTRHTIQPEDFGLVRAPLEALRIKSPAESADVIRAILSGRRGPHRDHTLLNAAAALSAAGIAADLPEGVERAAISIDGGAAAETLKKLAVLTETEAG